MGKEKVQLREKMVKEREHNEEGGENEKRKR